MTGVKMTPETELKQQLQPLMKARGWRVLTVGGSQWGARGFPDWYCTHRDIAPRWIECKVPPNGMSSRQKMMFQWFYEHRVGVWIITPRLLPIWERILIEHPLGNWQDFLNI